MRGNHFYLRLGKTLMKIRKQKKLTQETIAFLSHLDRAYINQIENGKTNPTIKTLYKISKALNVKISKILKTL